MAIGVLTLFAYPAFAALEPAPPFPQPMNAAEIQLALQKLNVLGRVLYVAAHPDDENTNLMALWANGSLYDAGYLSVTRGDGGQNLIGPELREKLGVIRTQELLAARRTDHGHNSSRVRSISDFRKTRKRRCGFGIVTKSSPTSSGSFVDFVRT